MRALICGISGPDDAYFSKLLLEPGSEEIGTSRDSRLALGWLAAMTVPEAAVVSARAEMAKSLYPCAFQASSGWHLRTRIDVETELAPHLKTLHHV